MSDLCRLIWCALIGVFRPRASLEAEILVLRHQLNVLRRKSPKRLAFGNVDRLVFAALYRMAPGVLDALKILKPPAAFPPRACVAGCDRTPERPLDCPPTNRSLRLATDATIYRSRSGLRVWRCPHRAASRNGHTGSADLATVAMAKRVLGEAHRFDPKGLSRPCYRLRRTTSPPSAQFLPKILQ